jgi:hypothetical protein
VEIEISMEMCLTHSMPLILLQFINILEALMEGGTRLFNNGGIRDSSMVSIFLIEMFFVGTW